MPTPLATLLRENYSLVAKDLLGPLLDVLNVGRARCGGDLDNFLIVLLVALRTVEDRRFSDISFAQVLSGEIEHYPSLTTNVRSIADSSGIPKETVRRKVAGLVEAGWIRRDNNTLSLTPLASRMLTEVREELLELAVKGHQAITTLERSQDR